jgi:hypothetical protein
MVGKSCPISFGGGEEVAMFGGVVECCDGGGEIVFSCVCSKIGVLR